ncbi:Protein dennd6a [Chytriomyces hyalinus]|nr:Protein dennd6a [Chytriomyces hyalinus]
MADEPASTTPSAPVRIDSDILTEMMASIEATEDLSDAEYDKYLQQVLGDSESHSTDADAELASEIMPTLTSLQVDDIPQLNPILSPIASSAMRESLENPGFSLAMLRRWCLSLCVVTFDLDLGPALEYIYPPLELSEPELKTICFSSFPDSNSTSHLGDTTFSFRFRSGASIAKLYYGSDTGCTNAIDSNVNISVVDSDAFTYAYVYFRQKPDKEIRRGYFQKSVVLLSPHPWHGFFPVLLGQILGPRIMDALGSEKGDDGERGDGVLVLARTLIQETCIDITRWPPPPSSVLSKSLYQNTALEISLLGRQFLCLFPPTVRYPQLFESSAVSLSALGTLYQRNASALNAVQHQSSDSTTSLSSSTISPVLACPGNMYTTFSTTISLMYPLWELLILGESILVSAETPKSCSQVVWALLELVKPVPFGGDFRPFFTLQDSEFRTLGRSTSVPSATILGVTNPFFDKVFQHWPHKVRVGSLNPMAVGAPSSPQTGKGTFGNGGPSTGDVSLNRSSTPMGRGMPIIPNSENSSPKSGSPRQSTLKSFMSSFRGSNSNLGKAASNSSQQLVTGRGSPIIVFDAVVESLSTKYKSVLTKDKAFLKDLADLVTAGASMEILNNTIRRHFIELTDKFLQPLNRYYEGLIVGSPLSMTLSALRAKPEVKPFQQSAFLDGIKLSPPAFPAQSRKSLLDFYRQFFKSANFAAWLQHRSAELNREWRGHYIDVLCDSDVQVWVNQRGRQEIECVDLLLRLKDEVAKYSQYFPEFNESDSVSAQQTIFSAADISAGFIPSDEQFKKLKKQQAVILNLLPESLRMMQ